MPELPEVETIRRGLAEVLPGRTIREMEIRLPRMFQGARAEKGLIEGAKVQQVARRGKTLMIELDSELTLLIHLKMTGQLVFREKGALKLAGGHPTGDMLGQMPSKHSHVIFRFRDGAELFFNDMRTFGYVRPVPTPEVPHLPTMQSYGPEPLTRAFSLPQFREMLKRRPQTKLKPLLLDQTFVAGLGNIYVDESLNLAKLHPLRTAGSLTPAQVATLYKAIRQVLNTALRKGGTSDNTYVTIRGGQGDYLKVARVYHRTGLPCRACGTPISRMVVAGRGTHYCPKCQKEPK